jgi:DNA-directed RNA polymerase subunit M/transcription elongation factor TFIIS
MATDNSQEEDTAKQTLSYQLTYALDPQGFFRRACSKCGLHFKLKTDVENFSSLLAPTFKRIETEHNISLTTTDENPSDGEVPTLTCPYCGHQDHSYNMLTDEFDQYVLRWATREIIYPLISGFFGDIEEAFQRNAHRQRNDWLTVTFQHDKSSKPIRPISGPELPDMIRAHLLCCNKEIKIMEGWLDRIYCPFCAQELILR